MLKIVQVTIPGRIFEYLDYLAPSQPVNIGCRVKVTLRGSVNIGIVVGISEVESIAYKVQPVLEVLDEQPVISSKLLKLARWMADYYQSPLGEVLKTMLPKKLRVGDAAQLPSTYFYQAITPAPELKFTVKQQALVEYLQAQPLSAKALSEAGYSKTVLNKLIEKNVVEQIERASRPSCSPAVEAELTLNEAQQHAVSTMLKNSDGFHAYLLFGITGSGKTEVYFQVMRQVLEAGKQVLVLVPEIGLTPQFLNRLKSRFDCGIAVLHSNLNDSERLQNWLWSQNQQAKILIGTRTAIFTPMPDLGLIIVDEEHDLSFKQQEGVRFSGRDVALKRGFDAGVPVILGSATPALESLYNVERAKFTLLKLDKRAKTEEKTYYRVIDLRNQKLLDGLCEQSLARITAHLEKGNQVMVFINRRGYAPIIICHECGWMADCPHCSAHLTIHAHSQKMQCHHCGLTRRLSPICESCQSTDLIAVGAGTERIANFLQSHFKEHQVLRVDRDAIKGKHGLQQALQQIESGDIDILVGTQLLAKGHHFKALTLVVVVDADAGFYSQDFRAIERLGQSLMQVAGRAGREGGGEVVIQTHHPDNELLNTLIQKGYYPFCQQLLREREAFLWPPYSYLALCRARAKQPEKVYRFFEKVKQSLAQIAPHLIMLGPAPAPMEKKAGQFQMQLLIRSGDRGSLLSSLKILRQQLQDKANQRLVSSLKFSIDVDPQDLS